MAQAPLGIPTDEACVAAARGAAALLEELGHAVEEVEVPTISEEMVPPFIALTQGGLADYEGVDWEATEPHIQHTRKLAGETGAYDYVLAAKQLELLSRREVARWGRDFDVLLTPTSAILPPKAGATLEAQHAAPDQPVLDVVASVSFTAFGNVTGPARREPAAALDRRGPSRRRPAHGRAVARGAADRARRAARSRRAPGPSAGRPSWPRAEPPGDERGRAPVAPARRGAAAHGGL